MGYTYLLTAYSLNSVNLVPAAARMDAFPALSMLLYSRSKALNDPLSGNISDSAVAPAGPILFPLETL